MMFIDILKYGFLIIFFATAVIGIASIPDWIKINEWYKKRIFVALILEVVGVVIILFKQELITTDTQEIPIISVSDNDWIALDKNGSIVTPEITIKTTDTSIVRQLGRQSYLRFSNLSGEVVDDDLIIKNLDSISLGAIKGSDLVEIGLFNSFKTANGEITSTDNYEYIQWIKLPGGQWKRSGEFVGPLEFEVYDFSGGTFYRIRNNTNGDELFDSRSRSKNLISRDNRIIHFIEYMNVYYLLRIAWADLERDEKYVHVINARLEPTIKEK